MMKPTIKSFVRKNNKITVYFDFKREDGSIEFSLCIEGKTEEEIHKKLEKRWKQLKERSENNQDRILEMKRNLESKINDLEKEI